MPTHKVLSVTYILVLAIACKKQNSVKIYSTMGNTEYEVVMNELNSGVKIDTVFLGYRFGMNRKDFRHHTKYLLAEHKVKLDYMLHYNLHINGSIYDCSIDSNFYKNKLYSIALTADMSPVFTLYDDTLLQKISLLYKKKYGVKNGGSMIVTPYKNVTNKYAPKIKSYNFFKGNLEIDIKESMDRGGFKHLIIDYWDIPLYQQRKQDEDSLKTIRKRKIEQKTKSDI